MKIRKIILTIVIALCLFINCYDVFADEPQTYDINFPVDASGSRETKVSGLDDVKESVYVGNYYDAFNINKTCSEDAKKLTSGMLQINKDNFPVYSIFNTQNDDSNGTYTYYEISRIDVWGNNGDWAINDGLEVSTYPGMGLKFTMTADIPGTNDNEKWDNREIESINIELLDPYNDGVAIKNYLLAVDPSGKAFYDSNGDVEALYSGVKVSVDRIIKTLKDFSIYNLDDNLEIDYDEDAIYKNGKYRFKITFDIKSLGVNDGNNNFKLGINTSCSDETLNYFYYIPFKVTVNYIENKCKDPKTNEDKKTCCQEDSEYREKNSMYCCDSGALKNHSDEQNMCCNGNYAYKYASKVNNYACCEQVPETCCTSTSFINDNWNKGKYWRLSNASDGTCCQTTQLEFTYDRNSYKFDTFKTVNSVLYDKYCVDNSSGKVCKINYNATKGAGAETINFRYSNSIKSGTGNVSIDISNLGIASLNENSIGFNYNSSTSKELLKNKIKIEIENVIVKNNKVTIEYNWEYAGDTGISNGNYSIGIDFYVCYDAPNPSDNKYPNNLSCASDNFSVSAINDNEYDDCGSDCKKVKLNCVETIDITNFKKAEELKNSVVYAGTGFTYPITIKDTVTCYANYSNIKTSYSSHDSYINAFSDIKNVIDNKLTNLFNALTGDKISDKINFGILNYDDKKLQEEKIYNGGTNNIKYTLVDDIKFSNITNGNKINKIFKYVSGRKKVKGVWTDTYTTVPGELYTSKSKSATYSLQLPLQYIHRMTGEISSNPSLANDPNYINAGNKFYTGINDKTGFVSFKIDFKDATLMGEIADDFKCAYNVQNILTSGGKTSGGYVSSEDSDNYITRPISLTDPFNVNPGEDGRAINWDNSTSNNDSYKEEFITNSSDDINTKPMYSFNFTAGELSEIRNYNSNNKGYNSWNFVEDKFELGNSSGDVTTRKSRFISCLLGDNDSCSNIGLSTDFAKDPDSYYNNNVHGNNVNRTTKIGDWTN